MANPYRGEAELVLGGKTHVLRLTLGALAELETAFGVEGLSALGARLSAGGLGARDLIRLLAPLLRGGGARLGESEVASMVIASDLPALVSAIGDCFAAAMPEDDASP